MLVGTECDLGAHIRDGLLATLSKRLTGTTEEKEAASEQFKTLFPKEFERGTILDFTWKTDVGLIVSVNGNIVGTCASQPLAHALFASYLVRVSFFSPNSC